jgi:hypothetical protein
VLGWIVLSDPIVATVLVWLFGTARTRGWRLAVGVATAWFVVANATSTIEAYYFGLLSLEVALRLLLFGILAAAGICLIVRADERVTRPPSARAITARWTPSHWVSRTAVSALACVVLYCVAGSIVILMPGVREFYAQRGLPSPLAVIALQLFVRGPAFALIIAMLARLLGGSRVQSAVNRCRRHVSRRRCRGADCPECIFSGRDPLVSLRRGVFVEFCVRLDRGGVDVAGTGPTRAPADRVSIGSLIETARGDGDPRGDGGC